LTRLVWDRYAELAALSLCFFSPQRPFGARGFAAPAQSRRPPDEKVNHFVGRYHINQPPANPGRFTPAYPENCGIMPGRLANANATR
jgi:hypothetical protein